MASRRARSRAMKVADDDGGDDGEEDDDKDSDWRDCDGGDGDDVGVTEGVRDEMTVVATAVRAVDSGRSRYLSISSQQSCSCASKSSSAISADVDD